MVIDGKAWGRTGHRGEAAPRGPVMPVPPVETPPPVSMKAKPKDIGLFLRSSKGAFPEVDVTGVESDWFDVGPLEVTSGTLFAGDPMMLDQEAGPRVKVPNGTYQVQVKGIDFKGHRRTARVRVWLPGKTEPTLGTSRGETFTDSGWIGVCDIASYRKAVPRERAAEYDADIDQATDAEGVGILRFEYAGQSFEMALQPSGLGDGTFPVFPLMSRGKPVGIEVEFIPAGFKLEQEIPGAGAGPKQSRTQKEFLKACEKGKLDVVRRLLKEDPGLINARGPMGLLKALSPLHLAAVCGQADVAELLLKSGHPVEAGDDNGHTPLLDACNFAQPEVVRVLLKYKASTAVRGTGRATPLHEAAYPKRGGAEVVRLLLAAGADPMARDDERQTPLQSAKYYVGNPNYQEQAELEEIIRLLTPPRRKK